MNKKVLVIGACGQIGSELSYKLREKFGVANVICSDIYEGNKALVNSGPFEILDAKNYQDVKDCVTKNNVNTVYLMAAILSAKGESNPEMAWDLNMTSLLHVLNLAKDKIIDKVFWPSSIAVFGPSTPKEATPQVTIMEPSTVYGISKLAGERWCDYYHKRYNVDVRSIRYPGIISWRTLPGGGTTDYAIDIFHKALNNETYECFLDSTTKLPMMFMDDAVEATLRIMEAKSEAIKIRSSYNLAAVSFTPEELANSIKQHIPDFSIVYKPDFRQDIANSWPCSIDDSNARKDWNWNHKFNLEAITKDMLEHINREHIN